MKALPRNVILPGDARTVLADLLPESIDAVVTSPPYFQLRDYGMAGQLGSEATVEEWVAELRGVFRLVAQVLKPHGCLWLNLGDTYSRSRRSGAPPKSLLLAPERLLLALAADGWLVRNKIVWAKRNPMPEPVTDRLASTWDPLYLLARSRRYCFDLDAIREPHAGTGRPNVLARNGRYREGNSGLDALAAAGRVGHPLGKNPGDVWSLPKATFRGAHFATFPEALVARPILATVPERICVQCDRAWRRRVTVRRVMRHRGDRPLAPRWLRRYGANYDVIRQRGELVRCACFAPTRPGVVLDPFFGTGTVGVVAQRLGRDWLGIELNRGYVRLAEQRLARAAQSTRPT